MNTVTRNILSNYLGKIWGFLSIFIFIRFYIEILGIDSYAIISFYAVVLGLLAFADSGLTATLTRELAKNSSVDHKATLIFSFERIYLIIIILIVFFSLIFSDKIAQNFLKSNVYSVNEVSYYFKLMAIGIAFQLFSTLYEGGLMGLEKQVYINNVKIAWSFARSGLVIALLFFSPNLYVYFFWQILCNVILLFVLRNRLLRVLDSKEKSKFSINVIKPIWKYALGMMIISLISSINIQIDKLVTGKMLDLKEVGYYAIASTLAQIPFLVVIPITLAIYPKLTFFVSKQEIEEVKNYFHKFSYLVAIIAVPIAICVAIYSYEIVYLWTNDILVAKSVENVVKILSIGGLFLCLQLFPFYLALANGYTKINIYTGIVGLCIIIPLIIYSTQKFGLLGVSFPWFIINLLSFFIISFVVIHKFLKSEIRKWFLQDILLPIFTVLIITFVVFFLTKKIDFQYQFILNCIIIGSTSMIINVYIFDYLNKHNKIINFKTTR